MIREINSIFKVTGGGLRFVLLVMLRSPVGIAMTAVNAVFLQQAFDAVTRRDGNHLTTACVVFGIASVCTFVYNGTVWSAYAAPLGIKLEGVLRVKLFDKISSFSYERIESISHGDWLTRLNTDVQTPFSEHYPHAAGAIVNIGVSSIILWRMEPAVYGWILLFVVPHVVFSQLAVARVMPGLNKKSLEAAAANTDDLNTLITCADIAALHDGQDYFMKRFEESSMGLLRANMKMRARNALNAGILPLFGLGGYLTMLIVGSGWIADGRLTFGDLTAAFQFRGGVLLGSFALIGSLISIQANMAGVRRLNEVLLK